MPNDGKGSASKGNTSKGRLNRRKFIKAGSAVIMATFAGCQGSQDDSTTTDGENTVSGESSINIGEFSVPSENVVPQSELRPEQEVGEFSILIVPQSSRPNDYEIYTLFAEECSKLGFDVQLEVVPRAQQSERAWSTDSPPEGNVDNWWQAAGWNFGARPTRADPHELLNTVFSPNTQDGYNAGYWEDPEGEFPEALRNQARELDEEQRLEYINQCQEILHDRGGIEYHYFLNEVALWNSERWDGFTEIPGLGPINLVSFNQLEPTGDRTHLVTTYPEDDAMDPLTPWGMNGHQEEIQTKMMYERLLWPSPDGGTETRFAREINYQDDTTVEVPIREGTEFWDGMEVLAEDVKFSYDIHKPGLIQPHSTYFSPAVEPIDEVEVADDYRVIFHLNEPFAPLEINTLARIFVGQKQQWEELLETDEFEEAGSLNYFEVDRPIGSGPLMIPEGETVNTGGNEITLERFDNHWDPVAYERRTGRNVPGMQTALNQLQAGETDVLTAYSGDPEIAIQMGENQDHIQVSDFTSIGHRFMLINNDNPPGHINAFRRAMSHRLPKDVITEHILNGWGEPAFNHPTSPAIERFWHDGLEHYSFDLQAAANKLIEAGFLWDEEENRLHMPEDRWYLTESEIEHAREAGLDRDAVTKEGLEES